MNTNLFAALSVPAGSNVPMAMLLTKATVILLLALDVDSGITPCVCGAGEHTKNP